MSDVFVLPPLEMLGPAMRALNERQRLFVHHLGEFGGDQSKAYAAAGYQCRTNAALRTAASRLARQPEIEAAIKEEALRRINAASLLAISTICELAGPGNLDNKLRLKAAEMIADRTGFHSKSEHTVVVKDTRTSQQIIDAITTMAQRHGLNPALLLGRSDAVNVTPEPIDAEFTEVGDMTGLEDL